MPSRIVGRAQLGVLITLCAAVLLMPLVVQTTATASGTGRSGPAPAVRSATPSYAYFYGASAPVKVRGQKWLLSPSYDGGYLFVELAHNGGGAEYHLWTFPVPSSSLTSGSHHTWTFAPPSSSTSPVATVDLRFTATKHSDAVCKTGSETSYTGSLKGKVELSTGFKHVGRVGSKSMSFPKSTLTVDRGCTKPGPIACEAYESAGVPGSGNAFLYGYSSKSISYLLVGNSVTLPKPSNAHRYDQVELIDAASTRGSDKLQMYGKKGEHITGSITVTGKGKATVSSYACRMSHKRYKETVTEWFTISAKSSIVGHFELGPNVKIPSGTHSSTLTVEKFRS
jgi:hypothetical protein